MTTKEMLEMLDAINEEVSRMTDEQLGDFLMSHSESFRKEVEKTVALNLAIDGFDFDGSYINNSTECIVVPVQNDDMEYIGFAA